MHRGYLSSQVKPGETASLFWYKKTESEKKRTEDEIEDAKKSKELRKKAAENIIFSVG